MRIKLTLEPRIIRYLQLNGNSDIDELVNFLHNETEVKENKIRFRIDKMISQKKLKLDNKILSLSKESQENLDEKYDEVFNYGPVKVARKGRFIFLRSKMQKEDYGKFLENIKEVLPELKTNLAQKFKEIEISILDKFDPLDVLAYTSATNLMADPETYSESSFKGKQLFPEIIQNIILKNKLDAYKSQGDPNEIPQIGKLLDIYARS